VSKVIFTQYRQSCVRDFLSCGKEQELLNGLSCLSRRIIIIYQSDSLSVSHCFCKCFFGLKKVWKICSSFSSSPAFTLG